MPLDEEILKLQQTERSRGLNYSDDEEEFCQRDSELMNTSFALPRPHHRKRSVSSPAHFDSTQVSYNRQQ